MAIFLLPLFTLSTIAFSEKCEDLYVRSDGAKLFNKCTLADGTVKVSRIEWPDGEKDFDVTIFTNNTSHLDHSEIPGGEKDFDVTFLSDHTQKIARVELPTGEKRFDVTIFPNKTQTTGHVEMAPRDKFAQTLTEVYSKRLREKGADPYRTSFRAVPQTLNSIQGLVIETNAIGLPANAQEFVQNSGWVAPAYGVGFRAIRLSDGRTTCDFLIVNPTTVRPGICFSQWMAGSDMRQEVVREWPKGYVFTVR